MTGFPIDTQIQHSLALCKVLMALHSDSAHFQPRSLICVCRKSKVVYRGNVMFPQDARVHIVKRQREHLCVSTEQCVDPCYACSHYFHALPVTPFLHHAWQSQECECTEQVDMHRHILLFHCQHSWRSFPIRGTPQEGIVLLPVQDRISNRKGILCICVLSRIWLKEGTSDQHRHSKNCYFCK